MKKLTQIITAFAYLTISANSAPLDFNNIQPDGFSYWHIDHWDVNGIHVEDPQSVPEPQNPIVLLTIAGTALLMKRKRN